MMLQHRLIGYRSFEDVPRQTTSSTTPLRELQNLQIYATLKETFLCLGLNPQLPLCFCLISYFLPNKLLTINDGGKMSNHLVQFRIRIYPNLGGRHANLMNWVPYTYKSFPWASIYKTVEVPHSSS